MSSYFLFFVIILCHHFFTMSCFGIFGIISLLPSFSYFPENVTHSAGNTKLSCLSASNCHRQTPAPGCWFFRADEEVLEGSAAGVQEGQPQGGQHSQNSFPWAHQEDDGQAETQGPPAQCFQKVRPPPTGS